MEIDLFVMWLAVALMPQLRTVAAVVLNLSLQQIGILGRTIVST